MTEFEPGDRVAVVFAHSDRVWWGRVDRGGAGSTVNVRLDIDPDRVDTVNARCVTKLPTVVDEAVFLFGRET